MTFRLATSRRIDRNSSPQGGLPSSRNPPTLTHLAEAEILDLNDLGKRRRIVNLGDRHVRRTDPRLVIGLHRGFPAQMSVKLCPFAIAPAREHGRKQATGGTAKRSEEHTSELHSLMRLSYAVFRLKKK